MQQDANPAPAFVIKAEELAALNYLDPEHPRPLLVEWINRGTDQKMKPSSVDMLLRTLFREVSSPSVSRLHQTAGLRAAFRTDKERELFAAAFTAARAQAKQQKEFHVTAIFNDHNRAEKAVLELKGAGFPESAISLQWRASLFMDTLSKWPEGHSMLSVAGAVAGGGVAGAIFGAAVLAIPGVGPVAAVGAIAGAALPSVAAVSGAIGATGGAIARMLTDHDVDGATATYFEQQIRRGRIFVLVDMRVAEGSREVAERILTHNGGGTATSAA
jgi:hypothetical protein